jgi:hypothetical protein
MRSSSVQWGRRPQMKRAIFISDTSPQYCINHPPPPRWPKLCIRVVQLAVLRLEQVIYDSSLLVVFYRFSYHRLFCRP